MDTLDDGCPVLDDLETLGWPRDDGCPVLDDLETLG